MQSSATQRKQYSATSKKKSERQSANMQVNSQMDKKKSFLPAVLKSSTTSVGVWKYECF